MRRCLVGAEASELREVRHLRDRLVDLLRSGELRGHGTAPVLTRNLAETVSQLDGQIVPTLQRLVARHETVVGDLAKYDDSELRAPDAEVLERVRAVEERQRAAIAARWRQSANAEAALLAISNESGDSDVLARQVRT